MSYTPDMRHYQPPTYTPYRSPAPPPTPEQTERKQLRKDAAFIGIMMLSLTLAMQVFFTAVVTGLVALDAISYEQVVSDTYLGLGNTGYLLLYAAVYTFDFLVPAVAVALLCKRRYFPLSPSKPLSAFDVFFGVLAGVGGCIVANFVSSYVTVLLESLGMSRPEIPQLLEQTPTSLLLNLLVVAVLPALLEEMVYRGYVLRTLRAYGDWFAVLVSALLFGLMHGNITQIPFALIVGIVLGWLYVMTDNIWLPVAVHFINNAMATLIEYLSMDMSLEMQSGYILLVFSILLVLGGVSLLILWLRHSVLFRRLPSRSCQTVGERCKTLLSSALFTISVVVYLVLTLWSAYTGG